MKKKIKSFFYLFLTFSILSAGCGSRPSGPVVAGTYYYPKNAESAEAIIPTDETVNREENKNQIKAVLGTDLYLIISNDMEMEHLILEQIATGRQYMYYYSLTTRFLNKYGDSTTVSYFEPGRIVNIGEKDSEGKLKEVRISDAVWEYPDITRYAIDEERGVFQIGDTKYTYGEDLFVVSDGNEIGLSSIEEGDKIRAIGMNKEILSIAVTTGYGEVNFINTEIFEGSYVQIGRKIFAEITKEMSLEIPEGTYMVTVANKGYGGSTEIVVNRNQTTIINLDELKGEGPKKGNILFAIDVAGAMLKIDGKEVSYADTVLLDYGIHSISVTAPGYPTYSKKLFVNSEEATILIALNDDEEILATGGKEAGEDSDSSGETTADGTDAGMAGSIAGSMAGSVTGGSSSIKLDSEKEIDSSDSSGQDSTTADYLSTLSELLSTIVK